MHTHIALHAPEHVFVQAGVVGVGERAMVLPGKSFAGKTTLVAALVRAGAEYWSDEYAVLDANGDVHPYAGCWRDQVAGVHDCGPRARPDQALAAVSRAATDAVVLEGERGEAEETAAALISTFGDVGSQTLSGQSVRYPKADANQRL
jgi:hypothetical protein